MKKTVIALLSGIVLLGLGIGITTVEMMSWDIKDSVMPFIGNGDKEYSFRINGAPEQTTHMSVYVENQYGDYDLVTVEYDRRCTDHMEVTVKYSGKEPRCNGRLNDDYGHISIYTTTYESMREIRDVVKKSFEEKVYYRSYATCHVDSIVIKTAYPEQLKKIDI